MTGTDVVVHQGGGGGTLAVREDQIEWTPMQLASLAQLGLEKAPAGDLQVFLHRCQVTKLDPFQGQIWMIARKQWDDIAQQQVVKYTMQTGIDGFRITAQRTGLYRGPGDTKWCGPDGVWRDVWLSDQPPVAARVEVYRADFPHPVSAIAHYREYVATKSNGYVTQMWEQRPAGQLAKCAEALALRRAFPHDMAGLYTDDELEHLGNPARAQMPNAVDGEVVVEEPAGPNWDARIVEAERETDAFAALKILFDMAMAAEPNNQALHQKIAAAGRAAKDRVDAAARGETPPPAGGGVGGNAPGGEPQGARRGGAAGAAAARPGQAAKMASTKQTGMIAAVLAKAGGLTGDAAKLVAACRIAQVSPVVGSLLLLTSGQASQVISTLKEWEGAGEGVIAERIAAALPDDGDPAWEEADVARRDYELAEKAKAAEAGGEA